MTQKIHGFELDDILKAVDCLQDSMSLSTRALYYYDDGSPTVCGSCVLISSRQSKFLLTAAHVASGPSTCPTHCAGLSRTIRIPSGFQYDPGAQKSAYDLAWLKLDPGKADELEASFISVSDQRDPIESRPYVAFGYSATKNKPNRAFNRSRGQVHLEPMASASFMEPSAPFGRWGGSSSHHLATYFGRKGVQSQHGERIAPDPHGMSGGALFVLSADLLSAQLAGLIIEYHPAEKLLLSLRLGYIDEKLG